MICLAALDVTWPHSWQASMMAGAFVGPAIGGVLADAVGIRFVSAVVCRAFVTGKHA